MVRRASRPMLLSLAASAVLIGGGAVALGAAGGAGDEPPAATSAGALPDPPLVDRLPEQPPFAHIHWRRSRAVGVPFAGRLVRGVRLPPAGRDFFTWDPVRKRSPNRWWRRFGHDRLIRTLLRVLRDFRTDNPGAPRIGVGDISRPRGGDFGPRFGSIGHVSHQNGLDVDVYYPRLDGRERRATTVSKIDLDLAGELLDDFVHAGAQYVFVGPATGLAGQHGNVHVLAHHDDHMHVRLRPRRGGR